MYLRKWPKSENWASLTPRSSAAVRRTEKSTRPAKLPGPWTTTWSKQYLSAVHPVTCSLFLVRCLFDGLRQVLDFQIFWFRHPDYDPDRAQKLISSSMSRHLSTSKISPKSMHAFLSNLINRQTDKHRGQSHIPPPLSEVIRSVKRTNNNWSEMAIGAALLPTLRC